MAQELVDSRTYTRKIFRHDDGSLLSRCHIGHIHYRNDITGQLEDVDLSWQDIGTHWVVSAASYRMRVAKNFAAPQLIEFQNRFDGAAHTIRYDPRSIVWMQNRDFATAVTIGTQQSVVGVQTGPTIRYPNAFGAGLHFELTLRRSGFTKEIVIDSLAALGVPPTGSAHVALLIRYDDGGLNVDNDTDTTWNRTSLFEHSGRFRVRDAAGRPTFISPAYADDAADRHTSIPVAFIQRQSALWQVKILPRTLLNSATFPLRADTTTSFYAGAGDGWSQATGASSNWDAAHDAAAGGSADATGTTLRIMSSGPDVSSNVIIRRGFFPIDTSGLPDGDAISAATFYATTDSNTIINSDNDGDDWLNIVGPTSQASNTTLATGDFDQCGAIDNPQELCDSRRDFGGITTSTQYSWALNATGRGIISKTGYTLIGMREGHDCIDSPVGSLVSNAARFHTSEATGTANDPYLEIVHSSDIPNKQRVSMTQAVHRAAFW